MDHPIPVTFIRLIVLLPLLGAVINFLAGAWLQKTFGKRAVSFVGCGVVILAFILAVRAFFGMIGLPPENRFMLDDLWKWFDVGGLNLDIAFWLDPLSMIMTLIITGVGGLIHIYSTGYMHDDDGYWRFFGWLNLFTFAMLVLVLGDNMWLMFVGWEGVGLCSFALIGFWYKVLANTTAGNKAFIVNRVGDLAFVIALYSLFAGLQAVGHPTLVTREVAHYAPLLAGVPIGFAGFLSGHSLVGFVTLLMFIGATGKSAQIPLYVWLPDAMAGPTPVSALIHAATMVTAGVYMVARLNFLFSMSPFTMGVIALVGGLTALFAATIGIAQNDIKKVLAYSTVSQLGYMFAALGVGAYAAGVFHLMTHAFFKACLFLGSGSVIHAMGGEQDMRKMGGLRHKHADHVLDLRRRDLRALRHIPVRRFLFQGRDHLAGVLARTLHRVGVPAAWRRIHRLLHVAPGVHDFLRRVPRHPRAGASPARIAAVDGVRAGRAWLSLAHRWMAEVAGIHGLVQAVRGIPRSDFQLRGDSPGNRSWNTQSQHGGRVRNYHGDSRNRQLVPCRPDVSAEDIGSRAL